MRNKTYDGLKWVALILLPAVATLYYAVAVIWHLPKPGEVVATITAVDTFMGALLQITSSNYAPEPDGTLHIDGSDPNADMLKLEMDHDLESLANKDELRIKVNSNLPS